jgi:gas vesicle protein
MEGRVTDDGSEEGPGSRPDEGTEPPAQAGASKRAAPGTGLVAGIIIGALLGAGIALLLAPEKGARTRRRLGRGLRTVRDDAFDRLDDATLRARRDLARRKKRLRRQLERGSSHARERLSDLR